MTDLAKYTGLLPSANASKPDFLKVLGAALQPLVDTQNSIAALPADFDIDSAVGAQLDAVGVRVGVSRRLAVPIEGVYFAFDADGVGFDEGVWLGPFDSLDGLTSLDDETYRLILKIKTRANSWDGSLAHAQEMIGAVAPGGTYLFIQDNFDMTMTVGVSGIVPSKLFVSLLRQLNEWLRPAAVELSVVLVTSESGSPAFGFDVENNYINGFDLGAWAVEY